MTRSSVAVGVVFAALSAVGLLLVLPSVALADNCSSLGDCWSTAAGAASAAFGAAVGAIGGLFGGGGGSGDDAGRDKAAKDKKDQRAPSSNEPKPFDPPWWWPGYQLFSGLAPDPSPPGFDPLNPQLGPPAVEGGMKMGQGLKATQGMNDGEDQADANEEFYRRRRMPKKDLLDEFGKKK